MTLLFKLNQNVGLGMSSCQRSMCAVSWDRDKCCTYAIAGVRLNHTTLGCGLYAAFISPQWPTLNTGYPWQLSGRAQQPKEKKNKHEITPDLTEATDKVCKTGWDTDTVFCIIVRCRSAWELWLQLLIAQCGAGTPQPLGNFARDRREREEQREKDGKEDEQSKFLNIQCIQKVFRPLHIFHMLLCCNLMLKLFKFIFSPLINLHSASNNDKVKTGF